MLSAFLLCLDTVVPPIKVPAKEKTMKFISKHTVLSAFALVFVLGTGTTVLSNMASSQPKTIRTEVSFVTDFRDPRKLVGFADDVFVGKVIEQAGTHSRSGLPQTLFKVEVLQSIKGSLSGTVTVNQQAGFSKERNAVILLEDQPLLQAGETYLFSTRVDGDGKWHTFVPGYGGVQVKNGQEHAALVEKFEKAKKDQVPYKPNGK
jgi:hypothetical protein